jgi:hypothetical protein
VREFHPPPKVSNETLSYCLDFNKERFQVSGFNKRHQATGIAAGVLDASWIPAFAGMTVRGCGNVMVRDCANVTVMGQRE